MSLKRKNPSLKLRAPKRISASFQLVPLNLRAGHSEPPSNPGEEVDSLPETELLCLHFPLALKIQRVALSSLLPHRPGARRGQPHERTREDRPPAASVCALGRPAPRFSFPHTAGPS